MSVDTSTTSVVPELEARPGGSLLRSEVRRITHRRLVRWLVLLGLVVYVGILAIAWTQYAKTTPAELAKAQARIDQMVEEQRVYRQDCLNHPPPPDQLPPGETAESMCPPEPTADMFGDVESFLPHAPFTMDTELPAMSLGLGALAACVCFLIGATAIGAEWSQKSLVALLFWEPRRLKVFATKVGVVVVGVALLAALAQALLVPIGFLFGTVKGSTSTPSDFWGDLLAQQARVVLLAVLLGLIGFGIANLVRNTGAALGAGFVYFVVEIVLLNVRPQWQPWYLTTNAGALVTEGGLSVYWETGPPTMDSEGNLVMGQEHVLTNLHGGLVIGGVALVLLVVGGWLFKRRDLT